MGSKNQKIHSENDCCAVDEKVNHKGHSHDDGHDHSISKDESMLRFFAPAIFSFVVMMLGLGFDYFFPGLVQGVDSLWMVFSSLFACGFTCIERSLGKYFERRYFLGILVDGNRHSGCICNRRIS